MNLIFRVVFWVLLVIVFLSIVLSTFFTSPNYAQPIKLKDFSMTWSLSWSYMLDIWTYDKIYSDADSFSGVQSTWATIWLSNPWRYLTSLREPGKEYTISWTWFLLRQEGIGEVYIDSLTSSWRVFIIPINTSIELVLQSETGDQDYTSVYLSPNMYLEFQTNRAKYLKNADRLRISTVFKLWYIWNVNKIDAEDILLSKYLPKEGVFFSVLSLLKMQEEYYVRGLSHFEKQEVIKIPGSDLIARYANLFVNVEKKKIFYKNKILEWYIELLNSRDLDTWKIKQIQRDMGNIAKIDVNAYDSLFNLQKSIQRNLYGHAWYEYVIPKIWFTLLSNQNIQDIDLYYPFYTYSLFTNYNHNWEFLPWTLRKFFQSFQDFSQDSDNKLRRYDYFLYFLEEQLWTVLNGEINDVSTAWVSNIISNYIEISDNAQYESRNQKITQIYSLWNILSGVERYTKRGYFLEDRNESRLLIPNNENSLWWGILVELRKSIEGVFWIYEENKNVLDANSKRDTSLQVKIEASKRLLDEYFLALESYERYEDLYDISKKNSLTLDTFWWNEDSSLSEKKAREYLSQFIWSSLTSTSIETLDDYYRVEKYIISGREFSFNLYPESGNKMWNISIDGISQTTQYKLDFIESDWDEKQKSAPSENKDQFEFSRFFLITFFNSWADEKEIFIRDVKQQEDKAEIVFKRDILLWDKWEFNSIKDIITIEYEDISLVKKDTSYDIFLKGVDFKVPITLKEKEQIIHWKFDSQYIFNSEDHYFTDLYSWFFILSERKDSRYYLQGKKILFGWRLHIGDITEILTTFSYNIEYIDKVYSALIWITSANINVSYNHFSKKTSLKFDSLWKKYTILLKDSTVDAIYVGTSKVQAENITILDLANYIK